MIGTLLFLFTKIRSNCFSLITLRLIGRIPYSLALACLCIPTLNIPIISQNWWFNWYLCDNDRNFIVFSHRDQQISFLTHHSYIYFASCDTDPIHCTKSLHYHKTSDHCFYHVALFKMRHRLLQRRAIMCEHIGDTSICSQEGISIFKFHERFLEISCRDLISFTFWQL